MHPVLSTVVCPQMRTDVSSQDTKEAIKTNWTKTHSTHDLTHASQSVLSLKSQQGVFETISIRSLGFVHLTTSVVKKELVKVLRQGPGIRGLATRVTERFCL